MLASDRLQDQKLLFKYFRKFYMGACDPSTLKYLK
jgi:hypothetical protein